MQLAKANKAISDWNNVKGKVDLINKYNKTRRLANHQLSTSYFQLQLATASYGYLSYIKSD